MLNAETLNQIKDKTEQSINAASSSESLEEIKRGVLGKKGEITSLMKSLKDFSAEERKELGALLNKTKSILESSIEAKTKELKRLEATSDLDKEWLDLSMPIKSAGLNHGPGSLHPLTKVQRELENIFLSLGFTVVDGPEVESDYYNFEALNIPSTHPARDMQDTFFTTCGHLLRTHTSSIQVRSLERLSPPLRIVAPGRCYRYERLDASHEHTFYQMEGMMIDKDVTVGHLIYFMKTLLKEIFGDEQKIRLRPGYFPFVEPGFELDIWFQGKWLELLPCGLIHPKVLEYGNIDPNQWSGFAFGLGLSRLVMSRFQIDDIRHLQGCDLRFLRQF